MRFKKTNITLLKAVTQKVFLSTWKCSGTMGNPDYIRAICELCPWVA
jgi:hypothetical protein